MVIFTENNIQGTKRRKKKKAVQQICGLTYLASRNLDLKIITASQVLCLSCIWMELNFRWMMPTILSISFGEMGRVLLCSRRRFITCVVNSLHACKGGKKNHSLGFWYFILSHPDINSSEFPPHLRLPMALYSRKGKMKTKTLVKWQW